MGKNYLSKVESIGVAMKKIRYLRRAIFVIGILMLSIIGFGKENYNELFIKISDAKTALAKGERAEAEKLMAELQRDFEKLENSNSEAGKRLKKTLENTKNITEEKLKNVATDLLNFEKEQNPVDEEAAKKNFKGKIYPALEKLKKAIETKDVELMKQEYVKYNSVWTRNEWLVRNKDVAYYGKIETSMSFLRGSMEMEPVDYDTIMKNFEKLKKNIENFIENKVVVNNVNTKVTLEDAIKMLEEGNEAFKSGDISKGQEKLKEFIEIWPVVEGDVSTRNSALYTKVESQAPIIMMKGGEQKYQEQLENLIIELSQINTKAEYNFLDAMWILLREGVEALLIVLAMVKALEAMDQKKGVLWVYIGALSGIVASGIMAVMLQSLFPAISSGTNREIIEGVVGIFAVVIMIGVGIWLHSKSSVEAWNKYVKDKMDIVLTSGSFISMFSLSFLAVFREGSETILFYVGILPLISLENFIMGVGLAIIILIIIALIMNYASSKIKIHRMFFILTWMIYLLAFKMLGTSIHMLQVLGIVPLTVINFVPTVEFLGIYANWQVIVSQMIFVGIVTVVTLRENRKSKSEEQ